jgi:drug/metabolite transporter (DMT)-like permease
MGPVAVCGHIQVSVPYHDQPMSRGKLTTLLTLSMLAFAGNSLLCRLALRDTAIDAATFTTVRLASGALVLCLIVVLRCTRVGKMGGNWTSALALFVYAAGFSFAYVSLSAATGALLLFGAVQTTMIGHGIWARERFAPLPILGFALALGGLVGFLLPGLATPPSRSALLMLAAGVAWGIYSLRGRGAGTPIEITAGNFARAALLAMALSLLTIGHVSLDGAGFAYAITAGALTSGVGYVIWYMTLPLLKATQAASVQLSVPVIAALGGVLLLGESLSLRLVVASIVILGGVVLTIAVRRADGTAVPVRSGSRAFGRRRVSPHADDGQSTASGSVDFYSHHRHLSCQPQSDVSRICARPAGLGCVPVERRHGIHSDLVHHLHECVSDQARRTRFNGEVRDCLHGLPEGRAAMDLS